MFFSKIALAALWWSISLAAVFKDTSDCAAFPEEDASQGEHAMIQHSKPLKLIDALQQDIPSDSKAEEEVVSSRQSNDDDSKKELADQVDITVNVGSRAEAQKLFQSLEVPVNPPPSMSLDTEERGSMQEEQALSNTTQNMAEMQPGSVEEEQALSNTTQNMALDTEMQPGSMEEKSNTTQNMALDTEMQPGSMEEERAVSSFESKYNHSEEIAESDDITANAGSLEEEQEAFLSSETSAHAEQSMVSSPTQVADNLANQGAGACNWECYLNRYPDLQKIVGAGNVAAAEEHWNSLGQKEGRDCTCAEGESFAAATAVEEDVTQEAAATNLQAKVRAVDIMASCEPWTDATQEALQAELKSYEASEKFQEKMSEAAGESPATAGHVAIMKYLREKVLQPGFSVLDLGCAAGGMLRLVRDEYDIGWAGVDYADPVPHDALVGVELVPGWVNFAQKNLKNVSIFEGDITEFSLPEPYASKKFDLVMLNDVMGTVEKTRYGCFLSQLDKVTRGGSIVYMHAPTPTGLLADDKQGFDKIKSVPHHFVMMGMASMGFELVAFEHDMDTVCGGEGENLPKQLEGAHCYHNGMPKYTHNVFRKVYNAKVLDLS